MFRRSRRITWGLAALLASAAFGALGAPVASASGTQEALFQDSNLLLDDPAGTLAKLRLLGVDRVRLFMHWNYVAPAPHSRGRPAGFHAVSPAAYPKHGWALFDNVITQAKANGIGVDLDVGGGAPLWATAPGAPKNSAQFNWMPSPSEFAAFVHAVGQRYSGAYNPKTGRLSPGDKDDLPRVSFWSVWNEPDYGPSLAPQGVPSNPKIEHSPWMYRNLVDAAWSALHQTGHGRDTFLFGEVAPRGYPNPQQPHASWGIFSGIKPLQFLRNMYCVDAHYRPLRGIAAALRGCPRNAAGSRNFRVRHPALFKASGFSDHPYSRWYPPNVEPQNDRDYSSLADIGQLTRALDRLGRVYGSHTRFPIWNTEYGYITSPPKHSPDPIYGAHSIPRVIYINQSTAAYYINWAEYLSWRNPRIASTAQYLLVDPLPALFSNDYGGFASGLFTFLGKAKPTFNAYRLPVYLPRTTASAGESLEVWGCARPSKFITGTTGTTTTTTTTAPGEPQTVSIEFAPGSSGAFKSLQTVPITNPRGYFDTRVVFPRSGYVRLRWSYPPADAYSQATPVFSRVVHVTVR
jgi:hypothetical protein